VVAYKSTYLRQILEIGLLEKGAAGTMRRHLFGHAGIYKRTMSICTDAEDFKGGQCAGNQNK